MSKLITISDEVLRANTNYECATEVDLKHVPRLMLQLKRDEVIKAYCDRFNFTAEEILEFEDGIDDWIGFGSVTCFELGGGTLVGYGFNELQMVVL